MDLLDESKDELVFGVEAESGGSDEDISDISSSLPWIGIEGEECVQLSNMVG